MASGTMPSVTAPRGLRALCLSPVRFALAALAFYILLLAPMAATRGFDPSVFILAGDHVVDRAQARHRIAMIPDSYGYDGQYFYRLAVAPWSTADKVEGVSFDVPAKRMLRILYPILARGLALGQDALVPATLVIVNLLGLAALAATGSWFARAQGLPWWFPCVVVSWPGFLVSLTHDTAEIITAAFLLAALACYLRDHLWAYATLAALAMLARETSAPIFLGILAIECGTAITCGDVVRRLGRLISCGLPFVPIAAWWFTLAHIWQHAPQSLDGYAAIGWPFLGVARILLTDLGSLLGRAGDGQPHAAFSAFRLLSVGGLLAFAAAVATRLPAIPREGAVAGLALGWVLTAALLSLLSADLVWMDPHSYFRVVTECWLLGWLVLALLPADRRRTRLSPLLLLVLLLDVTFAVWVLCYKVLPDI